VNIFQPKLRSEKLDDDDDDDDDDDNNNNNNNKYQQQPEAGVQEILRHDLKTSTYTTRQTSRDCCPIYTFKANPATPKGTIHTDKDQFIISNIQSDTKIQGRLLSAISSSSKD